MLKHELAAKCLISRTGNSQGQWARVLAEDDHLLGRLSWQIFSSNGGVWMALALQSTTSGKNMDVEAGLKWISGLS